jgi:hypothetical protein
MHFLTKKHLSRRLLLRGAGTALALPLLESMLPAASAWAASAGIPQSRLACIYIAHGAVMDRWMPATDGSGFEFTPTLQALEPFRDRLNVLSDMTLPFAYGSDASAGANHSRSSSVWLTCTAPGAGPTPTSLDQVAAAHIGQDTPLPSLELSLDDGSSISYRTPTTPLPMEQNPQVVFERLFGDGSTAQERSARQQLKASLLDSVSGDVAALQRTLPGADKMRLERYLEDVREIERRLQLVAASPMDDLAVPDKPVGIPDSFTQHAKLMFDLMTLAWQAEITRVSTLMVAREISNRVYGESGINDPFHNLSHHSEVQANKDKLATLNAFHTRSTLAYFLQKLSETPDGDGSLLDHSLVLYGSGMSNSNQHDHDPLPILLAGGASGKLQGGRHIRAGVGTPLSNLHSAILDKLGVPAVGFGDSTGVLAV